MTTMIKICGLRDRDTVNAAIAAGADAVGFVFAESVRRVTVEEAKAASVDVPPDVLKVAVMLHPEREMWAEVQQNFRPDILQTDAEDFEYLEVADDVGRWPVIREGSVTSESLPETFVYEGRQSGKGQRVDWGHAAEIARRGRMILAGGLDAANVADAIERVAPWGVDVSSAVESAPGTKDKQKIEAFIAAARNFSEDRN